MTRDPCSRADFSCISQDDPELKAAGIKSLLGYAARCELVLVPCPQQPQHPVAHMVSGGYGDRAWTRLESFTFYCLSLLRNQDFPNIYTVATDSDGVRRIDFNMLPDSMPSSGVLFSEADRESIVEHEHTLLDAVHAKALQEAHTGEKLEHGCGGPALIAVCALGDLKRVGELLDAGVKVDSKDRRGYTAMISAARYNQDMCARALIAAGASQDTATDDGWTPLVMCARKGHLNMALLLLHAGADGEYTLDGKSCAEIADAKGHPDVAEAIRAHLDSNTRASASSARGVADPKPRRVRLSSAVSTNALHDLALHDLKDQPEDSETIAGNRRGSTLEELREGSNLDSAAPTPRRSRRSSLEYSRGLYGGLGVSFRGGLPNAPDDAGRSRRSPSEAAGVALA